MISISVLVLTLNEEASLQKCLQSLAWSDDIVVLDSGSNDRTTDIAVAHGCRVIFRAFDDWSTHQNWAIKNIQFKNPWVLYLDADEVCPTDLRDEIHDAVAKPCNAVAFRMRRKDFWQDTWMRHATIYPTWLIRLFQPTHIRYQRLVNPITAVDGPVRTIRAHLIHYPFTKGVSHWIKRHNDYSTLECAEYEKTRRVSVRELLSSTPESRRKQAKILFGLLPFRPLFKFLYLYVVRRGFLDGRVGLDYALLQSVYEYFISLKLRERARMST